MRYLAECPSWSISYNESEWELGTIIHFHYVEEQLGQVLSGNFGNQHMHRSQPAAQTGEAPCAVVERACQHGDSASGSVSVLHPLTQPASLAVCHSNSPPHSCLDPAVGQRIMWPPAPAPSKHNKQTCTQCFTHQI